MSQVSAVSGWTGSVLLNILHQFDDLPLTDDLYSIVNSVWSVYILRVKVFTDNDYGVM